MTSRGKLHGASKFLLEERLTTYETNRWFPVVLRGEISAVFLYLSTLKHSCLNLYERWTDFKVRYCAVSSKFGTKMTAEVPTSSRLKLDLLDFSGVMG